MSAEKIIQRIQADAEQEAQKIKESAEKEASSIMKEAEKEAQVEIEAILHEGDLKKENAKKVLLSKVSQEVKRDVLQAREEVISQCFEQATSHLKSINGNDYKKIVKNLITLGKETIEGEITISTSRSEDAEVAKEMGIAVSGKVSAIGGILIHAKDGSVSVDNTFDSILKRRQQEIRRGIGQLLFS